MSRLTRELLSTDSAASDLSRVAVAELGLVGRPFDALAIAQIAPACRYLQAIASGLLRQ